jgi:transcriptional regulator with XRE-family HTH domain
MEDLTTWTANAPHDGQSDGPAVDGFHDKDTAPWPADHRPATGGERSMWWAFDRLRKDPDGPMTQQAVAEAAGMARTMVSQKEKGYVVLRQAIRDEVSRRKEERRKRRRAKAKPNPVALAAAREANKEERIDHWKAVAQVADSAVVHAEARAVRAENGQRQAVELLARILADFKAGRWVQADPAAVVLGEIQAFMMLGAQASKGKEAIALQAPG